MTPSSRSDGRVTTEQREQVLLIGIDRVSQQNRIDPTIYSALASAYYQLEHDENVRCGVLFGYGNDFSLGLDVAAFAPVLAQGTFQWQVEGQINPLGTTKPRLTKPLVAAVQGGVSFMANELLLAADIRIAASNAHFSQGEAQRATFPGGGATIRFVREAGWGNAMRYMLTGDEFDATEALRIGLVQEVVAIGQQLERALELAQHIAAAAPLSIQATLASAHLALTAGEEEAARQLLPEFGRLLRSQDMRERMNALQEGRQPTYTGR